MAHRQLQEEEREILQKAAELMTRHRGETAYSMLVALMLDLAACNPSAGDMNDRWIASVQALGETCLTLAKLACPQQNR